MLLLDSLTHRFNLDDPEERRVITGVHWHHYEALLTELGDTATCRVAYLDGTLEIVAPSRQHERKKTQIGTLLELYFVETETDYFPMGSTTLRKLEEAGGEPDESYCIGSDKAIPDLVIEVIITSGGINRLDLFRRLGVAEVWFWQGDRLFVYHWREDVPNQFRSTFGYEVLERSELLPNLDIGVLAECIAHPNPLTAVKRFRQWLQAEPQIGLTPLRPNDIRQDG